MTVVSQETVDGILTIPNLAVAHSNHFIINHFLKIAVWSQVTVKEVQFTLVAVAIAVQNVTQVQVGQVAPVGQVGPVAHIHVGQVGQVAPIQVGPVGPVAQTVQTQVGPVGPVAHIHVGHVSQVGPVAPVAPFSQIPVGQVGPVAQIQVGPVAPTPPFSANIRRWVVSMSGVIILPLTANIQTYVVHR